MRIPLKPSAPAQQKLPIRRAVTAPAPTPAKPPAAKKPAGAPEPDGHFKQTLGRPIKAPAVTVGMQIVWAGKLEKVESLQKPTQATDTKGKTRKAPLCVILRFKDGPTIIAKPGDTFYREITEAAKVE